MTSIGVEVTILEWILLGWTLLGFFGGAVYASQGGFYSTRRGTGLATVLGMGLCIALAYSGALTWFGMALLVIYIFDTALSAYKFVRYPTGRWVEASSCMVSCVVSAVVIVLLLTVGVTV